MKVIEATLFLMVFFPKYELISFLFPTKKCVFSLPCFLTQGLKKTEQQTLLEDFNRHGTGIIPQTPSMAMATSVSVPAAPVPLSPAPSPSPTSAITNREDVLTRAAALGRGAATTGFRRFLALTEAAKDRKDGPFPFRKLFNT